MTSPIPLGWHDQLVAETTQPYCPKLMQFVAAERAAHTVFPPEAEVFSALAPAIRVALSRSPGD